MTFKYGVNIGINVEFAHPIDKSGRAEYLQQGIVGLRNEGAIELARKYDRNWRVTTTTVRQTLWLGPLFSAWLVRHNVSAMVLEIADDTTKVNNIPFEDLRDLRDTCMKVLEERDKAAELLPITEWDSAREYGEDYFDLLRYAATELDRLFAIPTPPSAKRFFTISCTVSGKRSSAGR